MSCSQGSATNYRPQCNHGMPSLSHTHALTTVMWSQGRGPHSQAVDRVNWSIRSADGTTPLFVKIGCCQEHSLVFKVRGPILRSRVLLPFYRKNSEVYPVWCSRLHNHTLFIKKLCKKLEGPSKFWESGPPTPSGCAHGCYTHCLTARAGGRSSIQSTTGRLSKERKIRSICYWLLKIPNSG